MKVTDISWENWQADVIATLLFVQHQGKVLLIRKKRGLGAGKINGPGGKTEPGEAPRDCAIRETQEELQIDPLNVVYRGELFFHAEDEMPKIHGYIYVASDYNGTPTETDEAIPLWFAPQDIPYHEMWEDDQYWLPQVLAGKTMKGWFTFEGEALLDYRIEEAAEKSDV
ncbi:MAG: 8-oxo-dGTP diphosphatase [Pseudomonadales bacterium]|nr:8-oxo-dGTP diphosphatase [Pseudomonadales bacterium]